MSTTADELTISFFEDNLEKVRELDKVILSKGAWTTIMFCYQDWDNASQSFGPVKYSIRRYQKQNEQFWMKSKFNISSEAQAKKIVETLSNWIDNPPLPEN